MLFENIDILLFDGTIMKNSFLLTKNDKIEYIGKNKPDFKGKIYNGKNKLIIPGFINTHCHTSMTLLRGVGADLPLDRWLNEKIFPIEAKLTKNYCKYSMLLGIAEMLKSGITSFSDMYIFNNIDAVLESGIKSNISLSIACDNDKNINDLPLFNENKYIYENYNNAENGKLKIDFSIHSEYSTTEKIVTQLSEYVKTVGATIQLHLSETEKEVKDCIKRHKKTPPQYFDNLKVFENNIIAAHCVHLFENDFEILAKNNVNVSHCPISNLKLGSGIADIYKMCNYGINVTVGTDGVASNDNLNILEDIKVMALLQKGFHKNSEIFDAKQILKISSKNGAIAQKRENTGEIAVGNKADIVVVDFNSINMSSATDMLSAIIYSAQPTDIKLTMVDGKVLYENGNFNTIDIEKVIFETNRIKNKIIS